MRKLVVILATLLIVMGFKANVFAANKDTYIKEEYVKYAADICKKYDNPELTPQLVIAMIEKESGGNASVVSNAGAIGLMQILPKYQYGRMKKLGVTNLKDPKGNIKVGVDLLNSLLKDYDNNVYAALMFYNAGYAGARRALRGDYSNYAKSIVKRAAELDNIIESVKIEKREDSAVIKAANKVAKKSSKKSTKSKGSKNTK